MADPWRRFYVEMNNRPRLKISVENLQFKAGLLFDLNLSKKYDIHCSRPFREVMLDAGQWLPWQRPQVVLDVFLSNPDRATFLNCLSKLITN